MRLVAAFRFARSGTRTGGLEPRSAGSPNEKVRFGGGSRSARSQSGDKSHALQDGLGQTSPALAALSARSRVTRCSETISLTLTQHRPLFHQERPGDDQQSGDEQILGDYQGGLPEVVPPVRVHPKPANRFAFLVPRAFQRVLGLAKINNFSRREPDRWRDLRRPGKSDQFSGFVGQHFFLSKRSLIVVGAGRFRKRSGLYSLREKVPAGVRSRDLKHRRVTGREPAVQPSGPRAMDRSGYRALKRETSQQAAQQELLENNWEADRLDRAHANRSKHYHHAFASFPEGLFSYHPRESNTIEKSENTSKVYMGQKSRSLRQPRSLRGPFAR